MREQLSKHAYHILALATLLVIGLGTVFYHFVEHFKWLDSYYFSVVTLATVGYGDFVPHTALGKLFTTFYLFIGVGLLTTFITFTLRRRVEVRMKKRHPDETQK